MKNQKFYVPGLVLCFVGFFMGIIAMPIEAFVIEVISLIMNWKNRNGYRTKLALIITVITLIITILYFIFRCWTVFGAPNGYDSYWFFRLLKKENF